MDDTVGGSQEVIKGIAEISYPAPLPPHVPSHLSSAIMTRKERSRTKKGKQGGRHSKGALQSKQVEGSTKGSKTYWTRDSFELYKGTSTDLKCTITQEETPKTEKDLATWKVGGPKSIPSS